jgi:hypothetical protein
VSLANEAWQFFCECAGCETLLRPKTRSLLRPLLSLGFSIFEILIIVNQHQADPNGLSGGSSFAMFGVSPLY